LFPCSAPACSYWAGLPQGAKLVGMDLNFIKGALITPDKLLAVETAALWP
jgi:hypothetical protein